jgi:hypothetical protein
MTQEEPLLRALVKYSLCEEWQIADLDTSEFEVIERVK